MIINLNILSFCNLLKSVDSRIQFFLSYLFIRYILVKSFCSYGLHENDGPFFFSVHGK